MYFFQPFFVYTPKCYGGWLPWLYGFIFTFGILEPFIVFYLFKKITNIQISWWMYLVNILIKPIFINTLLYMVIPLIYALFTYLFVTKRHLSFIYITTNMIIAWCFLDFIAGILGPLVLSLLAFISPAAINTIYDYCSPIIRLFELLIATLIVNQIKPLLRQLTVNVSVQSPTTIWLFNIFLLSQSIIRVFYGDKSNEVLTTPLYILINIGYLVATLLFINITTNFFKYKSLALNQKNELYNLQAYTSHIESMYDDLRRFRHDYKNILLSLTDAIQSEDIKQVREIFSHVVQPTNEQLNDRTAVLGHLENIKNLEIKSIVYGKVITAINDKINTTVEVADPFSISNKVEVTDILRIIAILFDNAINAAKDSAAKEINFSLFTKGHDQYIVIQNSTKEEKINIQTLSGRFHSILGNHHSLGLRNLRIILARYPFIQHNSSSNNYHVTQEIIIHN